MRLRRNLALFALIAALLLSLMTPAMAAETEGDRAAAAETAAAYALEYGGATSLQYALWEDGEITLSGALGVYSKTENRALTEDILYGIGSVSKIYTTAAVMQLVEAGKVDLDQPVTAYLPEFTMADSRYRDITVRMLLNHSSGLMGTTNRNAFLLNDTETDATADLLEELRTQTLQADPGAYSVYCNDGFTLAELIVERISGMDFADYIAAYITGPLALESTFAPGDDFDTSRLAKTYLTAAETRPLPPETFSIVGAGGLYATASDLAAFGGAFCSDALLIEASREAMAADEYLRGMWPEDSEGDLLAYGLGWDSVHMFPFSQNEIQALVKGGDSLVYHAGLVVLPEYNMAAAVVSSGGVSTYNELAAARMLIDALAEQGVIVNETAALDEAAAAEIPAELMDLGGTYGCLTGLSEVDVSADGVLTLTTGDVEQTFTYRTDGSFRDETNSVLVRLVEEENGEIYLFQKAYQPLPGLTTMCVANYALERLPDYTADEETLSAWENREGKIYLLVNEHYTSALYPFSSVFAGILSTEGMPESYLSINQLTDAYTASPVLQIPGTGSRDAGVIHMVEQDGVEYIELAGSLYRDAATVESSYPGERSYCTVSSADSARWYTVGAAAGKVMTVEVPEGGAFAVYDASFQLVASSWAYGDTTALLPEGGYIVFAAGAPCRFDITLTDPAE